MSLRSRIILTAFVALAAVGIAALTAPHAALAACGTPAECLKQGVNNAGGTGASTDIGPLVKSIVNIMLFVLGAAAVIMIVIGGIRYTLSGGDSAQVQSAKNTILYAVIGVIVALLAYAIVNFVISNVSANPATPAPATTQKK